MQRRRSQLGLLLLLAAAFGLGCAANSIDTEYGLRRGVPGQHSVNGTAVLADIFEQAGYRVSSRNRISPKLQQADIIVWAPDSFRPPAEPQREFLQSWLNESPGRTLIYIGRDYDAETAYWNEISRSIPASMAAEVQTRRDAAKQHHASIRMQMPADEFCHWFIMRRDQPHRCVCSLEGPWSREVDASKAAIELHGRLEFPQRQEMPPDIPYDPLEFQPLLTSQGDLIVGRYQRVDWPHSQILVVVNGSFLLNVSLVNLEHRKLAARLIDEVNFEGQSPQDRHAVFLETDDAVREIYEDDPEFSMPVGFEAFRAWPLGFILLHLLSLGIIYCFASFPIFGRPRPTGPVALSDFGKHIAALGKLLERTEDGRYAATRLGQFQRNIKQEAGPP